MENPTIEIRSNDATSDASVAKVDMKLEVVVIPVSDVDRAKEFYKKLGWRLDVTPPIVVQFTPPGSWCSVQFGKNLASAARGSAKSYLIVSDIVAARDELVAAGIEVGEFFHIGPEGRVSVWIPSVAPTALALRSTTLTATPGSCRKLQPGFPGASTPA